ncbi:invasion associated locus B family protein [Brucella pseudogrignonensis]|uniref:invasion associated locus B family protein n=1 Tax=Brucella pseudogrignonensis TaxID=419475 RepID=UPI0038B4ED6F
MFNLMKSAGASCVIVFAISFPALAASDDANAVTQTYDDWQVVCKEASGKRLCAAVQQVAGQIEGQPNTKQRLIAVEIIRSGDSATGSMILPFGINVSKGVSLGLDKTPENAPRIPFKTCIPAGCIVPLEFSPQAVDALKKASRISVGFEGASDRREKTMEVSLKGFAEAFESIK